MKVKAKKFKYLRAHFSFNVHFIALKGGGGG